MDKIIVSNLNRSEEVSSFGDRDARYINSAVAALNKPGDIVVVEAQHRSLRDHYIKQILSLLFVVSPGVVVNRCKKDRDWMIGAINQAFVKNKVAGKGSNSSKLSEVWIVDLSSGEDFDLLKLAQTLVSQFEGAGVCMVVSCSPSITHQVDFCRWSNRLDIPVWTFELPDASAIDAFLEREAKTGAINEARKLVHELRSLQDDKLKSAEVADLYDLQQIRKENSVAVSPLAPRTNPHAVDNQYQFHLGERQLEKGAEIFADELDFNANQNGQTSVSDSTGDKRSWAGIRVVIFGFLIVAASVASVFVMVDDSVTKEIYEKAFKSHVSKVEDYFSSFREKEFLTGLKTDVVSLETNLDGLETEGEIAAAEVEAVTEDFVVTINAPLEVESDSVSLAAEKVDDTKKERNFELKEQLNLNDFSDKTTYVPEVNLETVATEYPGTETNLVIRPEPKSLEYFAQLAAFGTENGAIWWKLSRDDSLPTTFVARKSTGLWAVLSGPFDSRELAKDTFSRIGVDVFVVKSSDLITKE